MVTEQWQYAFYLFYAVNPLSSEVVGIFSGRNIKTSWFQPILLAILFLIGTWIFFDMVELAFIHYALIYFLLGIIVMAIVSFLTKKK